MEKHVFPISPCLGYPVIPSPCPVLSSDSRSRSSLYLWNGGCELARRLSSLHEAGVLEKWVVWVQVWTYARDLPGEGGGGWRDGVERRSGKRVKNGESGGRVSLGRRLEREWYPCAKAHWQHPVSSRSSRRALRFSRGRFQRFLRSVYSTYRDYELGPRPTVSVQTHRLSGSWSFPFRMPAASRYIIFA